MPPARTPPPLHDRIAWPAMAGIIATVTVFAVSQGLSYPLLSFILERQGTTPGLIGLSAAMTPLGFIVSSLFIPTLARRLGGARLAILCSLLAALTLIPIAWTQNIWAWMPLRFLLGVFANPLYVISETWLITITPASRRGSIMGLYVSIASGGFAIGPLTLGLVGTEGWPPFLIGIGALLLCGLIVVAVRPHLPKMSHDGEPASVVGFFRLAPVLLLAVFMAAAFEQSLLSMLAIYGAGHGSPESRISALIACFILGNAALQIPFGRLAERVGSARVMLMCAVGALLGCALLPLLFSSGPIWPMVFVWGAVTFGIYTMAMMQLGERFSGQRVIAGNAAFAMVWGMGGMVGAPATGLTMQVMGNQGLPAFLGLLSGVLVVSLAMERRRGNDRRAV